MSLSSIPRSVRTAIFLLDDGRCRYNRLAQVGQASTFHVNHVIPRSKGGFTDESNLVLQCPYCSLHKSDKSNVVDPSSGESVLLFHPLTDAWSENFEMHVDGLCRGVIPKGRATVDALRMNDSLPQIARALQIRLGLLSTTGL